MCGEAIDRRRERSTPRLLGDALSPEGGDRDGGTAEGGVASEMNDALKRMARGEQCRWAITLKGDDKLIGAIELRMDDGASRNQRAFWLSPQHWGRGLMTEPAERLTEFDSLTLGWSQLWLTNAATNFASHRIKEK